MSIHFLARLGSPALSSSLLLAAATSMAQTAGDMATPTMPSQLRYASPLRTYKPFADLQVESWREANDRVNQIGGWRAYAKEMRGAEADKDASKAPPQQPAAPAADPHAGHHGGTKP